MSPAKLIALFALSIAAASANAYEFRCRWVERVGTTDVVIGGDGAVMEALGRKRIRFQIGVFDGPSGPAPAGGLVGWRNGILSIPQGLNARTPGRLTPFNWSSDPHANGFPVEDPFRLLTSIDATLGLQQPLWLCGAGGVAPPQPPPVIRARNSFVSIYEFTFDPRFAHEFLTRVEVSGDLIAALEWQVAGAPTPPNCGDPGNPQDDQPGFVAYAPITAPPVSFECTLRIEHPVCLANINNDFTVDSQDFFAFLVAFFEQTFGADFNQDGTINSADFFDFVEAFFAGC